MRNLKAFLVCLGLLAIPALSQTIPGGGGGGGSTSPGGSNTQCQYNNSGAFGGVTGCTSNGTAITLVAPALGTPASGVLTNAIGLPISSGVSGLGTGVGTALGVNVGSAGAPVVNGGALGTPSSGTLTNTTGLPTAAIAVPQGNGTKVQLSTGTTTTNHTAIFDANGNIIDSGGVAGTGTVTSVATGACLTGGTITTTGTLSGTYVINAQTGPNYTVVSGDACKLVTFSNAASIAVTLPQATGSFGAGFSFDVQNLGAGLVTITPTTSTINAAATLTIPQGFGCSIPSDGTNYQVSGCTAAIARQGNGLKLQLSTGSTTTNDCLKYDANGNAVDAGAGCSTSGGGMFNYSDNGLTLTAGTYFAPVGGGGSSSGTESVVSVPSPSATTVTNLSVSISTTLGGASSGFTVTLRKNNADTTLTCNFNPSAATTCTDFTHSVSIAQSDILAWKIVTAGTIVGTPTVSISSNNGTSNVGVTQIICNGGLSGGTITTTGTCSLNLSNNNTWVNSQRDTITAVTASANTYTPNFDTSASYSMTLAATNTIANPSTTPVAGQCGRFYVKQDGTGSRTVTWGSQYIAAGSITSIVLSTAANAEDTVSYCVRDSTHILLSMAALNPTH